MKLVIIGNGFDIHHNYKTSFNNFREFLIKSKKKNLVDKVDKFIKDALNRKSNSSVDETNLLWNQFEELLNQFHPSKTLVRIKNIDNQSEYTNMIDLLDDFTEEFFNYIKEITSVNTKIFNEKINNELSNADLIITFNYSSTYNIYELKPSAQVFHINGCLEEGDLPIIGYHQASNTNYGSVDYLERFRNFYYSKSALAYKRNSINYDNRYREIIKSFSRKIDEFVSIGFSFGSSDSHIKEIIQALIVSQVRSARIPLNDYKKFKKVNFKVFNYNDQETDNILSKLQLYFPVYQALITGIGFKKETKDLITFSKVDY